jgi:hypothetical protein
VNDLTPLGAILVAVGSMVLLAVLFHAFGIGGW